MNRAPQPADGGADIALLKIAAHQLRDQRPSLHQVFQEMLSRNAGHMYEFSPLPPAVGSTPSGVHSILVQKPTQVQTFGVFPVTLRRFSSYDYCLRKIFL